MTVQPQLGAVAVPLDEVAASPAPPTLTTVSPSEPSDLEAPPSALAPFRSRIFLALWTATLLSNFGGLIQNVGATWLMTSLAPSADMVALVQVATVLPIMLFSLPAGAAADVFDHRRVMLAAQLGMLAASVALAALAWFGHVTPWTLIALTFLIGAGAALFGPAWQSSVREQVSQRDLPAAVALNGVSFNLARAVGPALGGVLVAVSGASVTFGINAVSYLGLIAVLIAWRRADQQAALPPETLGGAMLAGLRFARLSHALQAVLVRASTFGFFAAALWALIPLVARDLLAGGAITYGLLLAAFGLGAVGAALGGTIARARLTSERIVIVASLAFAGAGLLVALVPSLPLGLPALFVAGAGWLLAFSTFNATVQLRSPRWVVGRAIAIYQMGVFGGLALGAWLWGVAADRYGVPIALLSASVLLATTTLLARVLPMPATDVVNLEPATDAAGTGGPKLDPEDGPVVTSTSYRVSEARVTAFLAASRRLRRMRGRNGARRWALLQDVVERDLWIERFETPTWLDYLRLRDRMTIADRSVESEVLALHEGGPPEVRHLRARIVPDGMTSPERGAVPETASFDPNLPPRLRQAR